MTIETESGGEPVTKSGPYNGNGVTTAFDYDFQIQDETELVVTRQNSDGSEDTLTLTTDYTVSGVGADTGGQITLTAASKAPSGSKLVIQYDGDYNQSVEYSNQGAIQLALLENAMDKLTMHLRSLKEIADRAVTVDAFGSVDPDELRANINILAAIASDLTTVAGISANVTTVAGDSADVQTLAALSTEVATLAAIAADITTAAATDTDISTVAGISADISAVAGVAASVATVAGISANVATVAGISSDVSTLAVISADVENFASLYLGAKASDPATDNNGDPLQTGATYFNTSSNRMRVYDGADWDFTAADTSAFGTAATKDVTTSSTDSTADSITKVGDFGLGALTGVRIDDLDLATESLPSGRYSGIDWLDTPYGTLGAWAVLDVIPLGTSGANYRRQYLYIGSSSSLSVETWYRTKIGGTFSSNWIKIWTSDNLFIKDPSAWSEGDILYHDGTEMVPLGIGSAGQALKVNSAEDAPEWATAGKTWLAPVATTSGTAIDVTSLPAGINELTIQFRGVSTNGSSHIIVQFGTASGFVTTGYETESAAVDGTASTGEETSGFILRVVGDGRVQKGAMRFYKDDADGWIYDHTMRDSSTVHSGAGGAPDLGDTLTQIRLTTVGGTDTFDAGEIVIGYQ